LSAFLINEMMMMMMMGDCVGRFSKVLKCSCHLAATDALSDSSFP